MDFGDEGFFRALEGEIMVLARDLADMKVVRNRESVFEL